jgi:putative ABC transport system permease protein
LGPFHEARAGVRTPLAWHNLVHDRLRTVVALTGVAFAVVLVFLQLGSYGAVLRTATLIYSRLDYDVLVRSREYFDFFRPGQFSLDRLIQSEQTSGVVKVSPFYIAYVPWQNPVNLQRRGILLMAYDPQDSVFTLPEIRNRDQDLTQIRTILMDRMSRPEFGPQEVGMQARVGRELLRVIGFFTMGTGFGADGAIVTSAKTYNLIFPQRSLADVNLGLIKVAPNVNPETVAAALRQNLPPEVEVVTRKQAERAEQRHWTSKTSVGVILATGLGVGVLVGIAIVYQVLSSNIAARLSEYATLKALGYTSASLAWMVVQQALILAAMGFLPGLIISYWLYDLIRNWAHIPIDMTWPRLFLVLAGSIAMCSIAAVLSLRKVYSADPAELF